MNDQDLHALVEAWIRWRGTRRLFVKPPAPNLLARMQPAKLKEPPDARLSADLSWFDKAVEALIADDDADAIAFVLYYVERTLPVKTAAAGIGVARSTFYVMVRRFARRAWKQSRLLAKADRVRTTPDKKPLDGPDD